MSLDRAARDSDVTNPKLEEIHSNCNHRSRKGRRPHEPDARIRTQTAGQAHLRSGQ
jgi:hypothetical protein